MKNKIKKTILMSFVAALLFGCSKSDDYKKYLEGGDILYSGKLDSVKINPGNNRVQLTGLLKADPKINRIKIFWNDKKDSIEYPVNMNTDPRRFTKIFNVEEGIRSFLVYTFDVDGNRSIAVNAVGRVYGPRYAASLNNRVIGSATQVNGETVIDWLTIDLSAGPFATEIQYISTTGLKTLRVPIATERTKLNDLASTASTISTRTLYLPTKSSIDTFYTEFAQVGVLKDVTAQYMSNTNIPFTTSVKGDRWGIPAGWTTNDAVRNFRQAAGVFYGGVDAWFGGPQLAMEAGWSADNMATITDGKIYQSPILPAGLYTLEIDIPDCTAGGDFYTVAAEGDGIPNTGNIASSLAYAKTNAKGTHKITFTLTTEKKVSLGFVGNVQNKGAGDGTFWRISQVRLKYLPKTN
ncbi:MULTISPECIES: DUF4998 domain-containing protein [unclassified Pedobacter]|uniref:DUF4998 domain-containing protein n=1 Tax=unclassified Pedobacter TaxID=2628915 RepID=UPI001420F4A7|nr:MULTISPECIES: DUF4998 domain-containing protein [unclassified Pedobacter]NII82042.1 hypothetical protein [Pedobacter sp. SG908]NMN36047.1 hypothetical protein [Pedobacter sp. SG918]